VVEVRPRAVKHLDRLWIVLCGSEPNSGYGRALLGWRQWCGQDPSQEIVPSPENSEVQ
jgi:hypothetical protein